VKIFLSHSWQNKTVAWRLYNDLKPMAEVWFDQRELEPGVRIQPAIDEALATMDLVVVLWSKHAKKSDNVQAEILTARKLGKKTIYCLLTKSEG